MMIDTRTEKVLRFAARPLDGKYRHLQCNNATARAMPVVHGNFVSKFNDWPIRVLETTYRVDGEILGGDAPSQVTLRSDGVVVVGNRVFHIEHSEQRGIWMVRSQSGEIPVYAECTSTGKVTLTIRGYSFSLQCYPARLGEYLDLVKRSHQHDHRSVQLRAPMPGLVKAVNINIGATVRRGESIIVLEAMKMENLLRAPTSGIVRALMIGPGTTVEKGDLLCTIELDGVH